MPEHCEVPLIHQIKSSATCKTSTLLVVRLTAMLVILSAAQCRKHTDELSKLPSITQEGKKTFGCLVNGKAWVTETENLILTDPPLRFGYENFNGGVFYISARRILTRGNIDQSIIIGIDSCTSTKTYRFNQTTTSLRFAFNNYNILPSSCITLFSGDTSVVATGQVTISRLSFAAGIISGTFELSLSKEGCENISITNGRFDSKL